jgi:hypothetical protein
MEAFRATLRNKGLYYVPDRKEALTDQNWLLVSFVNQWFNVIDLRSVLKSCGPCPYPDLQLRWIYPQAPQKLSQSLYKEVLQGVDFRLWVDEIISNFDAYTQQCHCQTEHETESRFLGHLATGSIERIVKDFVLLDRFQRGPPFRETPNGDLADAVLALNTALNDLQDRHPAQGTTQWIAKVKQAFQKAPNEISNEAQKGSIDLQRLLFPAEGRIASRKAELDAFLEKYVILPSDKCRGNYFVVCKNLYIRQYVHALHHSPQYQLLDVDEHTLIGTLLHELSGLLHYSHFSLIAESSTTELPYFYELPKPHKNPLGWRPVAASHRSVLSIPHKVLTQVLGEVLRTLKAYHEREYAETVPKVLDY